ncbi:hypothetical protein [Paenibacillus sp. LPE1-1-1.1]|uniref:hypothetical protein n=1 Tax=Paenibacillus sp. LPE1-1-1.1 TaxID=3135230 RepID=UPI003419C032
MKGLIESNLPVNYVIENVFQYKMRGKVAYQSHLPAAIALNITLVKAFDDPSGKGYQRPVDPKRTFSCGTTTKDEPFLMKGTVFNMLAT